MIREEFIMDSYDQENRKLSDLYENSLLDKPKAGCEAECKDCEERIEILEQMILEIPMEYIENDKVTGSIQQIFIGKIEDQPVEYVNCKDFTDRHYYIDLIIKGCGDEEKYKNKRLLRLSDKVWNDWFNNSKYDKEKEQRASKNLCVYVKTTVIDGEVREIEWYK